MNIIKSISNYLNKKDSRQKIETPEGVCPNCWGKQEYDKKIRVLMNDKQIDVNNKSAKHAFIKEFVVNNIDGIRLKKNNNSYECPSCKASMPIK